MKRLPVALAGYGFPEWCVGYGPAPEPVAKFYRPERRPNPKESR